MTFYPARQYCYLPYSALHARNESHRADLEGDSQARVPKRGLFATLEKVVDRLCDTICALTADTISSITGRNWIIKVFN